MELHSSSRYCKHVSTFLLYTPETKCYVEG